MASHGHNDEQRLALFIDFENIAIGVRDAHYRKFDINLVLERLLEKGKVLVKKAYADWSRYSDYKRSFHEAAIELIEVPQKSVGGKNSADIRLVVDAMDMSFQKEHINCFVVASGDSDFSPLVSKLKENNKYVIGLGVKNSTSDLLIENCDEFIFYEDLVRGQQRQLPQMGGLPEKQQECFGLLVDSVLALQRENKELLWGSMVKETMKRKKPSFNETYYGFRTFSHLLEDAQRRGIVVLRRDQRSGSYVVEDLGNVSASGVVVRTEASARAERDARAESTRTEPAAPPRERSERSERAESGRAERAAERAAERNADKVEKPEKAAEAGAPAAEGETTNGRPRRRRSRGRRPRGGAAETGTPETAQEMLEAAEADEFDGEGGDEVMPTEGETEAAAVSAPTDAFEATPVPDETATNLEPSPAVAAGTPAPTPSERSERPEEDDKGGFSLFSWMRPPKDR